MILLFVITWMCHIFGYTIAASFSLCLHAIAWLFWTLPLFQKLFICLLHKHVQWLFQLGIQAYTHQTLHLDEIFLYLHLVFNFLQWFVRFTSYFVDHCNNKSTFSPILETLCTHKKDLLLARPPFPNKQAHIDLKQNLKKIARHSNRNKVMYKAWTKWCICIGKQGCNNLIVQLFGSQCTLFVDSFMVMLVNKTKFKHFMHDLF
jgi:hypothetical protein